MDKKKYDKVQNIIGWTMFFLSIIFLIICNNVHFNNDFQERLFYAVSGILIGLLNLSIFVLAYMHDDFFTGFYGGIVAAFIYGAGAFIMGIVKLVELLKEHVFK